MCARMCVRVHVRVCACACVCARVSVAQSCLALCDPTAVAHQAPLSLGFSGQKTALGCHSLHQGIFPTQGPNLGLMHGRQILCHLSNLYSNKIL